MQAEKYKRLKTHSMHSFLKLISITAWYSSLTESDKKRLARISHTASKITGANLKTIDTIYKERSAKKVRSILAHDDHPANCLFNPLPSMKRFRSLPARTNRIQNSFYVKAVRESCPHFVSIRIPLSLYIKKNKTKKLYLSGKS